MNNTDENFKSWLYRMWVLNRDERMNHNQESVSFKEYCDNNMAWLKLKYKEQKGTIDE